MSLLTTLFSGRFSGWEPPAPIYPTAFSPTIRDGYAGATFGIWATGSMRTVNHDATTAWLGVRTMSGISDGQKVSCWATVTGASDEVGISIGNASATMADYAGADANGFTLRGDVADVYSGGASVLATTGTLATGDRVRMDVDRSAATVQFYKQTGGTGAYVSMGAALDISSLGTGALYPIANSKNSTAELTWDFGQGSETPAAGFTAGPLGDWGWWNITSASVQGIYTSDDLTRMWTTAAAVGASAPNVASAGDPVGGWYDWEYKQALTQSTAGKRPEYQTDGILFDSTSVVKQMLGMFSRNYDATCWHAYKSSVVTGTQIKSGFVVYSDLGPQRMGFNQSATSVQTGSIRSTGSTDTASTVSAVGSDISGVLVYEGATAFMICDDGSRVECTVGTNTTNTDRINIRGEVPSSGTRAERRQVMLWGTGSLSETEARNLQYWMETAYP